MASNHSSITKATFQTDIKRKQAMFNRFKRRFAVSHNPAERTFLKTEAGRIVSELKQFSKRYQGCGFGGCTWITKGYTNTCFTSGRKMVGGNRMSGKASARKNHSRTAWGRNTWSRSGIGSRSSTRRGTSARRTSGTRNNRRTTSSRNYGRNNIRSMVRRSMVAW